MHVASPFVIEEPKNPDDIIKPAVEGTLNVLKAFAKNGKVKRVVLTSSIFAIVGEMTKQGVYDENDWADANGQLSTYNKSKALAEKVAWDFVNETKAFEMAVVNPGFVLGPLIHTQNALVQKRYDVMLRNGTQCLLEGHKENNGTCYAYAAKVNITTSRCSGCGLGSLESDDNSRSIGRVAWMKEVVEILYKEFQPFGYYVPTIEAPYFLLYLVSFFDKSMASVVNDYGKEVQVDTKRMTDVLKVKPTDMKTTLIDMGYSIIECGYVKKTDKYKQRL